MKDMKPKGTTKKPPHTTRQRSQMPLPESLHNQIARRAHEIYERRIRQGALDDWLQAEREILQGKPHRGYTGAEQEE
jgi:Protein of unknown function (DUF2934)